MSNEESWSCLRRSPSAHAEAPSKYEREPPNGAALSSSSSPRRVGVFDKERSATWHREAAAKPISRVAACPMPSQKRAGSLRRRLLAMTGLEFRKKTCVHHRIQPSAHAEPRRSMSVSHRTAKSTTAPNGATASLAQWRKPWVIAERFGLSSPVAGGRIDGADELCRPIRGCGVLVLAMFPGLAPLGYGTTAPFGAKNGNPPYRPTCHHREPSPPLMLKLR